MLISLESKSQTTGTHVFKSLKKNSWVRSIEFTCLENVLQTMLIVGAGSEMVAVDLLDSEHEEINPNLPSILSIGYGQKIDLTENKTYALSWSKLQSKLSKAIFLKNPLVRFYVQGMTVSVAVNIEIE